MFVDGYVGVPVVGSARRVVGSGGFCSARYVGRVGALAVLLVVGRGQQMHQGGKRGPGEGDPRVRRAEDAGFSAGDCPRPSPHCGVPGSEGTRQPESDPTDDGPQVGGDDTGRLRRSVRRRFGPSSRSAVRGTRLVVQSLWDLWLVGRITRRENRLELGIHSIA